MTLINARAMFAPYLLAAVFGIYALKASEAFLPDKKSRAYRVITAASVAAAAFIALANYELWLHPQLPDVRGAFFVRLYKFAILLVILAGSFVCIRALLVFVCYCEKKEEELILPSKRRFLYFLIPFAAISIIYLFVYGSCYYPGLMSPDSLDQVGQILSGTYSNHQPFYHTIFLGIFIKTGISLGIDINTSVAVYSVIQILFMALTFAFVVYNLMLLGFSKKVTIAATLWYVLMPFHVMYSFTVWKDVYFGAFVTLLIVFFIRIRRRMGNRYANMIGFILCGPVICLIRSNGLFVYVFVLIALLILMRRERKLLCIMAATIVVCFFCKHTVLSVLNVTQPDTVESLSIPLQQIARVIKDNGNIAQTDAEFLSNFIDLEAVSTEYNPDISDPVKNMIRDFGNEQYLTDHIGEFLALYVRTFIHNPVEYVIAWVDSTCGYWNSGYGYWVWYWDVQQNTYGLTRTVSNPSMLRFMDEYLWLFYNDPVLQIFTAIGLFVWIALLAFARCIFRKNMTGIIAFVPVFAIILSLVISSPVFAEFRYMYALFCALPILLAICLRDDNTDVQRGEEKT